jgi:hypothetical protein
MPAGREQRRRVLRWLRFLGGRIAEHERILMAGPRFSIAENGRTEHTVVVDCYPICLGRLAAALAFSLIVSSSSAFPETAPLRDEPVASLHAEKERWLQLKEEIAYHDELYYKKAAPEISDAQYDALKQEFLRLDGQFGEDEAAGSVGDDRDGRFPEARHLAPMLSL